MKQEQPETGSQPQGSRMEESNPPVTLHEEKAQTHTQEEGADEETEIQMDHDSDEAKETEHKDTEPAVRRLVIETGNILELQLPRDSEGDHESPSTPTHYSHLSLMLKQKKLHENIMRTSTTRWPLKNRWFDFWLRKKRVKVELLYSIAEAEEEGHDATSSSLPSLDVSSVVCCTTTPARHEEWNMKKDLLGFNEIPRHVRSRVMSGELPQAIHGIADPTRDQNFANSAVQLVLWYEALARSGEALYQMLFWFDAPIPRQVYAYTRVKDLVEEVYGDMSHDVAVMYPIAILEHYRDKGVLPYTRWEMKHHVRSRRSKKHVLANLVDAAVAEGCTADTDAVLFDFSDPEYGGATVGVPFEIQMLGRRWKRVGCIVFIPFGRQYLTYAGNCAIYDDAVFHISRLPTWWTCGLAPPRGDTRTLLEMSQNPQLWKSQRHTERVHAALYMVFRDGDIDRTRPYSP